MKKQHTQKTTHLNTTGNMAEVEIVDGEESKEAQQAFDRITMLLVTLMTEIDSLTPAEETHINNVLSNNFNADKNSIRKLHEDFKDIFSQWHKSIKLNFENTPSEKKYFQSRSYSARVPIRAAATTLDLGSVSALKETDIYVDVKIGDLPNQTKIIAQANKLLNDKGRKKPTKWEKLVGLALEANYLGKMFVPSDIKSIFYDHGDKVSGTLLSRRMASKISQLNRDHLKDYGLVIASSIAYKLELVDSKHEKIEEKKAI